MQSAGCYGICAAILRNPNCVLEEIDFEVSCVVCYRIALYSKVDEIYYVCLWLGNICAADD